MTAVANLSESRTSQVNRLRRAAAEHPGLEPLFEALAEVLESTSDEPFGVLEGLRWSPVWKQTLLLADKVLAGEV